jgi:peptidoglycan/LPS O-acetylase OafA/YrhL
LAFFAVVLALLIIAACISMEVEGGKLPEQQIHRLVSLGVASAGLVYVVAVIGPRINWPGWIVALGDRSYALYLGHPVLITVASVSGIFPLNAVSDRLYGIEVSLLFVGVALGFAHGYHMTLERPLYQKLRHLLKIGLIASDRPDGGK